MTMGVRRGLVKNLNESAEPNTKKRYHDGDTA